MIEQFFISGLIGAQRQAHLHPGLEYVYPVQKSNGVTPDRVIMANHAWQDMRYNVHPHSFSYALV